MIILEVLGCIALAAGVIRVGWWAIDRQNRGRAGWFK